MTGQSIIKDRGWLGCRFREADENASRDGIHRGFPRASLSVSFLNRWKEGNFIHLLLSSIPRLVRGHTLRTRGATRIAILMQSSRHGGGRDFIRLPAFATMSVWNFIRFRDIRLVIHGRGVVEKKEGTGWGVVVALRVSIHAFKHRPVCIITRPMNAYAITI